MYNTPEKVAEFNDLVDSYNTLYDDYEQNTQMLSKTLNKKKELELSLSKTNKANAALTAQLAKQSKELKRIKDSSKRKSKKPNKDLSKLQQRADDYKKVLATAGIRVGSLTDVSGVTYDVYDNRTKMVTIGDKHIETQELLVVNQYGSGRSVYRDEGTDVLVSKIPPEGRFKMTSGLRTYCENYFKLYDKTIEKSKAFFNEKSIKN